MRTRSRRKHRSPIPLDWRQFYGQELGGCLFQPLAPAPPQDPDFEVRFCEDILTRAPDHPEALALLGETYTRRGEYAKGLATDLRLSQLRPDSGVVHYNLACSYALTGQKELALGALQRAVELGYRDLEHLCHDRDLEVLRSDQRYQALVEGLDVRRGKPRAVPHEP